jgi:hypothetical protein
MARRSRPSHYGHKSHLVAALAIATDVRPIDSEAVSVLVSIGDKVVVRDPVLPAAIGPAPTVDGAEAPPVSEPDPTPTTPD